MEVPELYHYGRRGTWFGLKSFLVYMIDGIVQVSYQITIISPSPSHLNRPSLLSYTSSPFTRTLHPHLVKTDMMFIFMNFPR